MNGMNLFNDKTLKHYEGDLGIFDYDPKEFIICKYGSFECIHYRGKGKSIDLPKGCINTRYMFAECELPPGFPLGSILTLVMLFVCVECLKNVNYQRVFLLE